ncbi:MAG TPA: acylphosphatase [Nakamurella multipartita]|nr:acylphosphatase [Nakamurella multipartita]
MNWFGRSHDDPAADSPAPSAAAAQPDAVRMTAFVHGHVQGVGFRWFTRTKAMEFGLVGSATNLVDGRVEVVVEGPRQACDDLLAWLRGGRTPGRVEQVVAQFAPARGTFRRFDVG